MARTTITVQTITYAGKTSASLTWTAPAGAGAGNGWSFYNTGSQILAVRNTDTVTKTLTMDVVGAIGGITPADTTVTVPAASAGNAGYAFVQFPPDAYSATAAVDVDSTTGVTAALIGHP